MGNRLFGLDIARIVDRSIAGAGGVLTGVLRRDDPGTRDAADLAAGRDLTPATYPFRGFAETAGERRPGSQTASSVSTVSILGASISTVPQVNDVVTLEGKDWTLLELMERDPAAALYVFRAEAF